MIYDPKIVTRFVLIFTLALFINVFSTQNTTQEEVIKSPLIYINTLFENGSPLFWDIQPDGTILINLIYDYERASLNRANGHWYFQILAPAGSELKIVLQNFENIYNGRISFPVKEDTPCFISEDRKNWQAIPAELTPDARLKIDLHMTTDSLYLARLEPYTISDLNRFLNQIKDSPLVKIIPIGKTVEGRTLEIVRVGYVNAPYRILIRGRAHAWEPGGNWVIQGLIKHLLEKIPENKLYLNKYCLYILPMANKDRVARGGTRFNLRGMDLNRNWDKPADPHLCPENAALEKWLNGIIEMDLKPHLAIDFHNDDYGSLHISSPGIPSESYLKNMERFEKLLHRYSWFTTGSARTKTPTFGQGLVERYGIDALIFELNANWIEGLNKIPFGKDWELLGSQLRKVFFEYFK
jgi:hypothetical protein